jgi:hypothetical protein
MVWYKQQLTASLGGEENELMSYLLQFHAYGGTYRWQFEPTYFKCSMGGFLMFPMFELVGINIS